jgi:hypothetical protein
MATEGYRLYGGTPADYAANLSTGQPIAGAVYEVYDARFGNRVTDLRDLSDSVMDAAVSDNTGYVRFQAPESAPRSLYLLRDGEYYRVDADDIGRTVDELEAGGGGGGGGGDASAVAAEVEEARGEAGSLSGALGLKSDRADHKESLRALGGFPGTNVNAPLLVAQTRMRDLARVAEFAPTADKLGTWAGTVPAGDYYLTELDALLGRVDLPEKFLGMVLEGDGDGITRLVFKPDETGSLMTNRKVLKTRFRHLTLQADTPGCTAFHVVSEAQVGSPQDFLFEDVTIAGFKYGARLNGTDNASELKLRDVEFYGIPADGAGVYVAPDNPGSSDPAERTSDQFLNVELDGLTKWWNCDGPVVDMAKGGGVVINDLDASAYGKNLTQADRDAGRGKLIYLRGTNHNLGVQTFDARRIRCEAMSNHAGLVDYEWGAGQILFSNVDFTSQLFNGYDYDDMIRARYNSDNGAELTIRNSQLAGRIHVSWNGGDYLFRHRIKIQGGSWHGKASQSAVVNHLPPNDGGTDYPPVAFDDVAFDNPNVVRDALIGHRGETNLAAPLRSVAARKKYGFEGNGQQHQFQIVLPVGAIVRSFRAYTPFGIGGDETVPAMTVTNGGTGDRAFTQTVTGTGLTNSREHGWDFGADVSWTKAPHTYSSYIALTQEEATFTFTPNCANGSAAFYIEGIW